MTNTLGNTSVRDAAHDLIDLGYGVIALRPGTKIPAVSWREWRTRRASHDQLDQWLRREPECNLAIVCGASGVVVLDADSIEAEERIKGYATPMTARTPRGGRHAYFRAPESVPLHPRTRIEGLPLDLRAGASFVVVAPSRSQTRETTWSWNGEVLSSDQLPPIDPEWFPVAPVDSTSFHFQIHEHRPERRIRRAAAYLVTIEGAVSGNRGHDKTLYAAASLIQKFGLSVPESWPLFLQYNARCLPPWTERELFRKLKEAERLNPQRGRMES
jgi:hypothetical protein